MKKLRIGIFVDNYFPKIDGVVMVIDNYARLLSKYAVVYVIAPNYSQLKFSDLKYPYHIIRVNSINVPFIGYNLASPMIDLSIKKRLLKKKFDIIHVHSPFTLGKLGIKIAKELDIPVVATLHSQFKQDIMKYAHSDRLSLLLTKKLIGIYNDCNECYTVNKMMCAVFKEYGYQKEPIIIPNATDFKLIDNKVISNQEVNQKYGLNSHDNVLLFVGRINTLKNILFIVDVLKILKNKKQPFKMLFVGDGTDMSILKKKIKAYNLENDIILCGEIKDRELIKKIYARSKLFIFPSLYDTNSLVQLEAASQKVPTIFLKGSATSCNVTNNVNGFIAPNNKGIFAKRIIEILNDEKLYQTVSLGAYRDLYVTYQDVVNKLYLRYLELINKE